VPDTDSPLVTDLYELTMAAAYWAEGLDGTPSTFSLFTRSLPAARGYLVAAGLEDALAFLEGLSFGAGDLSVLEGLGLFDPAFLDHLGTLRFTGSVLAVPEGRVVLAQEPILEVDAPLLEAQLVESGLLNRISYQTAVASKAARLVQAADGRPVSDFGLRSAHGPEAGLRLARSARIAGMASTSNVAGAEAYGLTPSGTMGHSFVLALDDETAAFEAFARRFGANTVLLVDTYDAVEGIARAAEVAARLMRSGVAISGLRIDSGNLDALSRHARACLDAAGLPDTGIFVTGGLDERSMAKLIEAGAPVAGFGVGAALAVPNDGPVLETAYKLVELDGRPVRKLSAGKVTWAGAKQVWRHRGGDVLGLRREPEPPRVEPLLVPVMREGRILDGVGERDGATALGAAAGRLVQDLSWLPAHARRLSDPRPPAAMPSPALLALTEELSSRRR
jgi:nicotinate phosphoribosyltransferase